MYDAEKRNDRYNQDSCCMFQMTGKREEVESKIEGEREREGS